MRCAVRPDKGTALIAAMIAIFVISGLIASLYTVVLAGSREAMSRSEHAGALERAEIGFERALATINGALVSEDGTSLVGIDPQDGAVAEWIAFTESDGSNLNPYSVCFRSFRRAGIDVGGFFDIYEITSLNQRTIMGGNTWRGMQAIVEVPSGGVDPDMTELDIIKEVFNTSLGVGGSIFLKSNAFTADGADWASGSRAPGVPGIAHANDPPSGGQYKTANVSAMDDDGTTLTGLAAISRDVPPIGGIIDLIRSKIPATPNFIDNDTLGTSDSGRLTYAAPSGQLMLNNTDGYGLLFVDGDLKATGNFVFKGIIVVTGELNLAGNGHDIHGAFVIAGDGTVNGTVDFKYNSARIRDALDAAGITMTELTELLTSPTVGVPVVKVWRTLDDAQINGPGGYLESFAGMGGNPTVTD